MDEPLLSMIGSAEESSRTPLRREFPSGFIDIGSAEESIRTPRRREFHSGFIDIGSAEESSRTPRRREFHSGFIDIGSAEESRREFHSGFIDIGSAEESSRTPRRRESHSGFIDIGSAEESSRTPRRREFHSGFIDIGSAWRQSTAHLITTDAIIPIITPKASSYLNLIANINKKRLTHRSHSAPSVFTDTREAFPNSLDPRPSPKSTPTIVWQAIIGVICYVIIGILIYVTSGSFKGTQTFKPVDALYFTVVTLCTIGYGDIVPDTTFTKLFTCAFIIIGFGFIDILLNGLVTYICDRQEAVMLSTVDENRFNTMVRTYMIDKEKGRMRIRMKVCLALAVVIGCIAIGTVTVHFLEGLSWVDSFYLSVTSVTTVGYGDYGFTTIPGRCFAIIWLLVSTFAVARAFLYLTELRIDKRNRRIAQWVLQKKMTLGDLVAADLDNDGSISKSEFIIYKLKEMGKIAEKDIMQICNQFDALDTSNCGKITLADLMNSD